MILKLSIDLPQERAYMRITRLLGRTLLEHLKVVEKDIDDIESVVGELCANVVRHSQASDRRFSVVLEYYADKIVVTVEDRGKGFSPKNVLEVGALRPDFEEGEDRYGGFGLHMVGALSDHLEFHQTDPQGTRVRAEKRLHYESPSAERDAVFLSQAGGAEGVDATIA